MSQSLTAAIALLYSRRLALPADRLTASLKADPLS